MTPLSSGLISGLIFGTVAVGMMLQSTFVDHVDTLTALAVIRPKLTDS